MSSCAALGGARRRRTARESGNGRRLTGSRSLGAARVHGVGGSKQLGDGSRPADLKMECVVVARA
jgi:hypothetical protein